MGLTGDTSLPPDPHMWLRALGAPEVGHPRPARSRLPQPCSRPGEARAEVLPAAPPLRAGAGEEEGCRVELGRPVSFCSNFSQAADTRKESARPGTSSRRKKSARRPWHPRSSREGVPPVQAQKAPSPGARPPRPARSPRALPSPRSPSLAELPCFQLPRPTRFPDGSAVAKSPGGERERGDEIAGQGGRRAGRGWGRGGAGTWGAGRGPGRGGAHSPPGNSHRGG